MEEGGGDIKWSKNQTERVGMRIMQRGKKECGPEMQSQQSLVGFIGYDLTHVKGT